MKSFNHQASVQQEAGSSAVSRPELERLEAQRRVAQIARILTPEGKQHVDAAIDRQRESRIREVRARLTEPEGRATVDFAIGKMRGTAKHGFDRSR